MILLRLFRCERTCREESLLARSRMLPKPPSIQKIFIHLFEKDDVATLHLQFVLSIRIMRVYTGLGASSKTRGPGWREIAQAHTASASLTKNDEIVTTLDILRRRRRHLRMVGHFATDWAQILRSQLSQ